MSNAGRAKKILAAASFALLLALALCPMAQAYDDDTVIRVGLSYSRGAQPAFNALADKGYIIGYFEGDEFYEVGTLSNRYVAFCTDTMLYTSGRTVTSSSSGGDIVFKPYHLEVERDFDSIEQAQDYIAQVRDQGYSGEIFPAYLRGVFRVRIEHYSALEYASEDVQNIMQYTMGDSVTPVGGESDVITVVDLNDFYIAAEIAAPQGCWPAVKAAGEGQTLKNSLYYYNGAFEFRRLSGGDITFLNTLPLSDYLKGVLPYEMNGDWPLEALKAQALCARSYVLYNLGRHSNYDICNSTHCQVYYGTAKETELVRQAVEETKNEVVTYQGKVVSTYYFSSSGGYTESAKNVWGGDDAPYCAAVPDPYEDQDAITHFSETVTLEELTQLISSWNTGIDRVADCYVSTYTEPAHNVYAVTFVGENGKTYTISGCDNVRIKLASLVKSPRFDILSGGLSLYVNDGEKLPSGTLTAITADDVLVQTPSIPYVITAQGVQQVQRSENSDGTLTFSGSGLGHNVGMSQFGAKGMAEQGYSYRDIILHYFTGVDIRRLTEMG